MSYVFGNLNRLIKIDFIRFCIVGGSGFIINLAILVILKNSLHIPIFISQLIGAEIALFSNFLLHDNWTYKEHHIKKSVWKLLIQFHMVSWPSILGSSIMVSLGENILHLNNVYALSISSIIALLWNFIWTKYVVWNYPTIKEARDFIK